MCGMSAALGSWVLKTTRPCAIPGAPADDASGSGDSGSRRNRGREEGSPHSLIAEEQSL